MYYIAMGYIKNCTYSNGCIICTWTTFFWCSLKWNSLQSYTHNQSSPICHSQALLCKSLILCWFILECKYDFNNFNLEKLLVTWFIISRPICKRHGLDLGTLDVLTNWCTCIQKMKRTKFRDILYIIYQKINKLVLILWFTSPIISTVGLACCSARNWIKE